MLRTLFGTGDRSTRACPQGNEREPAHPRRTRPVCVQTFGASRRPYERGGATVCAREHEAPLNTPYRRIDSTRSEGFTREGATNALPSSLARECVVFVCRYLFWKGRGAGGNRYHNLRIDSNDDVACGVSNRGVLTPSPFPLFPRCHAFARLLDLPRSEPNTSCWPTLDSR